MKSSTFFLSLILIFGSISIFAQNISVDEFDEIKASGNVKVYLVNSDSNSIDVEVLKGDADRVISKVNGKTLVLKIKNKWGMGGKTKAKITVYHNGINAIDASAGAYVSTEDPLSSDTFALDASSGSKCIVDINTDAISVEVSSGASIKAKGSSKTQSAEVSSGASYDGKMLESDKATVDVSSGASAKVWATKYLAAEASSGGSIKYKGDPTDTNIEVGKYSGGSIKKM